MKTVIKAVMLGGALGLALGVTAALFHINVRPVMMLGVALGPSISGLALGSITGLVIGLAIALIRPRIAPSRPAGRD